MGIRSGRLIRIRWFLLVILSIQVCALARKGQPRNGVSMRLTTKPARPKASASLPVPRGTIHHICSQNATAEAAWTSCHPEAFPQGTWIGANPTQSHFSRGSTLYGTAKAQRFIWAHQHPADCTAVKFLVYYPKRSGIGSVLHHMGQALAMAIEMRRVMVVGFDATFPYHSDARCGKETTFDACYFEPLSSCSWRDAMKGIENLAIVNSPSQVHDPNVTAVGMQGDFLAPDYHCQSVPPQFHQLLRSSPIDWKKRFYWWRAQSVAYIVRPNAHTLAEIALRKRHLLLSGGDVIHKPSVTEGYRDKGERASGDIIDDAPGIGNTGMGLLESGKSLSGGSKGEKGDARREHSAGIAAGTISLHVRHGDKHIESPAMPDERYLERAEQLLALGRGLGKRLFVSTEDPQTVEFFSQQQPQWAVQYTDVPRKPMRSKSTLEYVKEIGGWEEMMNSLLNLDLALECDAWVGTLSSNWCRLIDELRATVRCKAHGPYLDAEQENPPQELDW